MTARRRGGEEARWRGGEEAHVCARARQVRVRVASCDTVGGCNLQAAPNVKAEPGRKDGCRERRLERRMGDASGVARADYYVLAALPRAGNRASRNWRSTGGGRTTGRVLIVVARGRRWRDWGLLVRVESQPRSCPLRSFHTPLSQSAPLRLYGDKSGATYRCILPRARHFPGSLAREVPILPIGAFGLLNIARTRPSLGCCILPSSQVAGYCSACDDS